MMLGMRWTAGGWRGILCFLAAGLSLRLLLLHFHPPVSGDSLVYGDIATNVLRHHRYAITVDGVVKPTLIRLPGYPLFLSLCFLLFGHGNYLAAVTVQILLSLADAVLLGLLASRLMGSRAAIWALGLCALCPFTANYSAVPLTETLALFCTTLSLFSFERWVVVSREHNPWNRWLIPMSAAASYAALLRPDRALLCAVLLPAVAWTSLRRQTSERQVGLAPVSAMLAVFVLPLALWGARNWHVFHVFQPLSPKYANDPGEDVATGFMRWYRTWGVDYKNTVEVYWPYDGSVVKFSNVPDRAFDGSVQKLRTEQLLAQYNQDTSSDPTLDAQFDVLARERIAAHPVQYYFALPLARLTDMWLQPRTELLKMPLDWWRWRAHPWKTLFSFAYAALNVVYLVLAILGFSRWRKICYSNMPALASAMFAFFILRSILLATLDNAEQRYTIDCYPVILLLASFFFAKSSASAEQQQPSC